MPTRSISRLVLLAGVALGCGGKSPATTPAPSTGSPPPAVPIRPLYVTPFAGQAIAVIPLTLVIATDTLGSDSLLTTRQAALTWADSVVGEQLQRRRPEVKWVLPPDLRKIAHRAPSVAPDPDRMGQSVLRAPKLEAVPDPLRGSLRTLMALAGGRYALVPAALSFLPDTSGQVRAELSLVLADTRTGKILWRTLGWGTGHSVSTALNAALERTLPVQLDIQ